MKKQYIIRWSAVVLCMLLIFGFSAQHRKESSKTSKTISKVVKVVVEKIAPKKAEKVDVDKVDDKVRSVAHFVIFVLLGAAVVWAMSLNFAGWRLIIFSAAICVLYALLDETHQYFVPGRAFQWSDIGVDSLGAVLAVVVYFVLTKKYLLKDSV